MVERDGEQHLIDTQLVGKPDIGAWVLVFWILDAKLSVANTPR